MHPGVLLGLGVAAGHERGIRVGAGVRKLWSIVLDEAARSARKWGREKQRESESCLGFRLGLGLGFRLGLRVTGRGKSL